ncbi:DUF952 domain-containing protein [Polymorphobacter sp.]|uniref:DUF952 domain-containing protein n=1 Tax=Polymorphobacter sp. TaxID=1909290 RepID=UPI003F730319
MIVLKLLRPQEWAEFQASGRFAGSPDDLRDGYIHLSTPEQAKATAAKWFADVPGLMAIGFDIDTLGTYLRWEPSRGGALFPHYYNVLKMEDVLLSEVFSG